LAQVVALRSNVVRSVGVNDLPHIVCVEPARNSMCRVGLRFVSDFITDSLWVPVPSAFQASGAPLASIVSLARLAYKPFWGYIGRVRDLTVNQVAERLQIHPTRVRLLVRLGELKGEKVGRDWLIKPASVTAYERTRRPRKKA
jgi:excisionase family DNA binding protein